MSNNDLSIDLYNAWLKLKRPKKYDHEYYTFSFNLFTNIRILADEILDCNYNHSDYKSFVVTDTKRRIVFVPHIKDRIVHRYIYNQIIKIVERKLLPQVYSCREEKGLHKAVYKLQDFLQNTKCDYVLKIDIKKCFDNIDHNILNKLIFRFIDNNNVFYLTKVIINSYEVESNKGLPLGNITSQLFAHMYLNEVDRHIVNVLKNKKYIRYGDDFLLLCDSLDQTKKLDSQIRGFLEHVLLLQIQEKSSGIYKIKYGFPFLGLIFYRKGIKISNKVLVKIKNKININNLSNYKGVLSFNKNGKIWQDMIYFIYGKLPEE